MALPLAAILSRQLSAHRERQDQEDEDKEEEISALIRPPQLAYQAQTNWGTALDQRTLSSGDRSDFAEIQIELVSAVLPPPTKASFKLLEVSFLVISFAVLPAAPEHPQPFESQGP